MRRSRRDFLQLAGAAALAGCARPRLPLQSAPPLKEDGPGSLRAHAAVAGFLFGFAVKTEYLGHDEQYTRLVREQAAIVTAQDVMKWEALRPSPDHFNFDPADAFVAFAEANRKKIRGHTLCWYRQQPRWFNGYATAANARGLLRTHIETVVGRYAGRMHSWDVVNEAVEVADGRSDSLRESPWLKLIGPEYIEQAFHIARESDPQALLTYNEFGLEGEDEDSRRKRAAVLVLLRRLRSRGVPVDAVGLQAHLYAGENFGAGLRGFLEQCRGLGLQVFITELDINDQRVPAAIPARDLAVAEAAGSFCDVVLANPAVRVVMTWGITDRETWLNQESGRADHLPERPLPLGLLAGREDQPKPMFFAMRKAFDARHTG